MEDCWKMLPCAHYSRFFFRILRPFLAKTNLELILEFYERFEAKKALNENILERILRGKKRIMRAGQGSGLTNTRINSVSVRTKYFIREEIFRCRRPVCNFSRDYRILWLLDSYSEK